MNKVKVRCSVCGKSFKTPSPKKTICPSCDADAKRARHQTTPVAVAQPVTMNPANVDVRAALRAAQENQGQFGAYRPPAPPPPPAPIVATHHGAAQRSPAQTATIGARPQRPGARPGQKHRGEERPKPARPPRERKPRVQLKPFEPSPEQVVAIRTRYLQLAQPEYDGIRHQIANEMGIPLRAVKEVVKQLRTEQEIPSWWERGGNLPAPENIERVRELYVPLLPDPEVGVHKRIAAELKLTNTSVYQAIGQIRTELNLPRYTSRAEEETTTAAGIADDTVQMQGAAGE